MQIPCTIERNVNKDWEYLTVLFRLAFGDENFFNVLYTAIAKVTPRNTAATFWPSAITLDLSSKIALSPMPTESMLSCIHPETQIKKLLVYVVCILLTKKILSQQRIQQQSPGNLVKFMLLMYCEDLMQVKLVYHILHDSRCWLWNQEEKSSEIVLVADLTRRNSHRKQNVLQTFPIHHR